jgi:hypothetical protein
VDVATLADLLRTAAATHHHYEQTSPSHDGSEWYAPYISAREQGSTPEDATTAAELYMEGVR